MIAIICAMRVELEQILARMEAAAGQPVPLDIVGHIPVGQLPGHHQIHMPQLRSDAAGDARMEQGGGGIAADEHLSASLLRQAAPEARLGCIATGDQFLESREEKLRLLQDYNALCADMESAAVAQVCTVNRVPFAVLRCISDLADDEARGDYDQFEQKAAHLSAEILCKAVARME